MPDEGGPGPPMTVAAAPPPIPVAGLPLTRPPPPPPPVAGAMALAAPCAVVWPFTEGSYLRIGSGMKFYIFLFRHQRYRIDSNCHTKR